MPGVGSRGGIRTQDRVSAGMCERKEPAETPPGMALGGPLFYPWPICILGGWGMPTGTKVLGPPLSHTRRAHASQVPPSFLPLPLGSLHLLLPDPFPRSSKEWEYWWRYLHGLMPYMSPSSPLGHREQKSASPSLHKAVTLLEEMLGRIRVSVAEAFLQQMLLVKAQHSQAWEAL